MGKGGGEDDGAMAKPLVENVEEAEPTTTARFSFTDWKLFLTKTAIIVCATYLFIPLIALHNKGKVSSTAYAGILIALHVCFIIIYCYKVRFGSLDPSWRSLWARILGLLFCIGLLFLVAGQPSEHLHA